MSRKLKRVTVSQVEEGFPIPASRGHTRPLKYPWDLMKVGDSILVEGDFNTRESARCAAYSYGKRKNMTFVSRIDKESIRIWRTN